jgi:hypothetical protein
MPVICQRWKKRPQNRAFASVVLSDYKVDPVRKLQVA